MKKLLTVIFCITFSTAYCQQLETTKIFFKVTADCACALQLARFDKPAGQVFKMLTDSVSFAIEKETTGFYVKCGESEPFYIKVEYTPGEGFYRIGAMMPCDKGSHGTIMIVPEQIETFMQ